MHNTNGSRHVARPPRRRHGHSPEVGCETAGGSRNPPGLPRRAMFGAGNGIRTRDFDLGKVALYH